MRARIYQPAKTATQSGSHAGGRSWVLVFANTAQPAIDPLMGWTSCENTQAQVKLSFDSQEAAESYAKAHKIAYDLVQPKARRQTLRPRGYAENFAFERKETWTH